MSNENFKYVRSYYSFRVREKKSCHIIAWPVGVRGMRASIFRPNDLLLHITSRWYASADICAEGSVVETCGGEGREVDNSRMVWTGQPQCWSRGLDG